MRNYVVLVDPKGEFPRGSVVADPMKRTIQTRAGHSMIPVYPPLFTRHGLAGFVERHWGSGIVMSAVRADRVARHAIYVCNEPAAKNLYWAARLQKIDGWDQKIAGQLRLALDVSPQQNAAGVSNSPTNAVDLLTLGEPDANGGWNVGGSAGVSAGNDGIVCLQLYGFGTGVRVIWSAITQAE